MTELEGVLRRLERASLALNDMNGSNQVAIEAFDDRLEQAGVGISIWVPELVLQMREPHRSGWELGYMKLAKRWRTVVRTVSGEAPSGEPIPATDTGRYVKADVCKHLDRLANTLACEIERLVAMAAEEEEVVFGGANGSN